MALLCPAGCQTVYFDTLLHNNITNGGFFRPTVFLFGQKMLAVVKELQLEPGWKFKNRFYPEYVTKNFHP